MAMIGALRTDGERRDGPYRQRCLLACRLIYGVADLTISATVRDLSDDGARIRLPSPVALPRNVTLLIGRDAVVRDAQIAWRQGCDIGLKLGPTRNLDDPTDRSVRILRRLWTEMADRTMQVASPPPQATTSADT